MYEYARTKKHVDLRFKKKKKFGRKKKRFGQGYREEKKKKKPIKQAGELDSTTLVYPTNEIPAGTVSLLNVKMPRV